MPLPAPSSASSLTLEPGRVIAGKFVLERRAGFGGMAELWVATNQATAAEVCVKVLLLGGQARSGEDEPIARFRREAYAAARLSHRAIVRVFDLLELDAAGALLKPAKSNEPHACAIVMELLRGETLGDLLAKRGKLPLEEALDLLLPVLSALSHAHRAAVIHRDIKPDNVFLAADPDGHVTPKILDFGVSRLQGDEALTAEGVVVGTPSFMSPEQARGARSIDCRSDVFSAAVLLYLMVSGTNPFEEPTFAGSVEALLRRVPPPLEEVPPPIWAVLQRALEKQPGARFVDAAEMAAALRRAAGRQSAAESNPEIRASAPSFPAAYEVDSSPTGRGSSAEVAFEPAAGGTRSGASRSVQESLVPAGLPTPGNLRLWFLGAAILVVVIGARYVLSLSSPSPSVHVPVPVPVHEPASPSASASASAAASPSASVAPVVSAVVAQAAASVVSAAPTASSASARAAKPSPQAPARKPGEEPNKARDPGF